MALSVLKVDAIFIAALLSFVQLTIAIGEIKRNNANKIITEAVWLGGFL